MDVNKYIEIFKDAVVPNFIIKYLETDTLKRLKHVTQFCGCDYTKIYDIPLIYTRYDHSLVTALITWHFTHDKTETIAALLHDVGTPCFAHCIDYVKGDYKKQESSEKNILELIRKDGKLLKCLYYDFIDPLKLIDIKKYPILENKSPRLCADRFDGVLHTCAIWLHTNSLDEIKEIFDDTRVLINENGKKEIGFSSLKNCEKFVSMNRTYAIELQGNKDKYIMKYLSEIVKYACEKSIITLDDLYLKKEEEIIELLKNNFESWIIFNNTNELINTDTKPNNCFYVENFDTKKRNVIPLVITKKGPKRIIDVSEYAKSIYDEIDNYKPKQYSYVKNIKKI